MVSRRARSYPDVSRLLLAWFDRHRRDLPWRRTREPYAIWVSEVMLQQTQVSTVLPYYRRWMERFPSLGALAEASDDEVLFAWQGLGYYARARRLAAGARVVQRDHGGILPSSVEELRRLPGVGRYTAGAIASIAFDVAEPVVDGNVTRVLCRYYGLRGDPTHAPLARRLWEMAREILPSHRPGDHNQALMELGATLCTAQGPRCADCPLAKSCAARASGQQAELPTPPVRPPLTPLAMVAAVVRSRGRLLVVKLGAQATRWAGLWQFPSGEVRPGETGVESVARVAREQAGLTVVVKDLIVRVRHGVTRYRVTLDAYHCTAGHGRAVPRGVDKVAWKLPVELGELALPAAQRRIVQALGRMAVERDRSAKCLPRRNRHPSLASER
jgi:A/G-specific adenine glycosylase